MDRIRLLVDDPADGVTNMARDEALLLQVGRGETPPTLRFYGWHPPTISLGYFQRYADYEQLPAPAGQLPVVRRTTGGGAILHDREWTYALVLPAAHRLARLNPGELYCRVHSALLDTLELLNIPGRSCGTSDDSTAGRGPFFCFERRHAQDVLLDDRKLAGSAQRRTPNAVLQHGSIILANRFDQHPVASLGSRIEVQAADLLDPLLDALSSRLAASFDRGRWERQESAQSDELVVKYASREWTHRH